MIWVFFFTLPWLSFIDFGAFVLQKDISMATKKKRGRDSKEYELIQMKKLGEKFRKDEFFLSTIHLGVFFLLKEDGGSLKNIRKLKELGTAKYH